MPQSEPRDDADPIPAFWCVDVEPQDVQLERGSPTRWTSFEAMLEFTARIRGELARVSDWNPQVCWFLRMDPQIEQTHGHAAFVADAYSEELADLSELGDVIGVHPHALRWCDDQALWVNDFLDPKWPTHCVEVGVESFRNAFGRVPDHHRFGTCFLSEDVVATLDRLGVRVDLTVEPGTAVLDASNAANSNPIRGATPNYRRAPEVMYRPKTGSFLRPESTSPRQIAMVPMSATVLSRPRPMYWRAARSVRHGFRTPRVPLSMWRRWPSPTHYWDVVEQHLAASREPYFAFSVRTDPWELPAAGRVRAILDELPRHRIARRLRFVDPLEVVSTMPRPRP